MGELIIFVNFDIYLYKDGFWVIEFLDIFFEKVLDFLFSLSWVILLEILVYLFFFGLGLNFEF